MRVAKATAADQWAPERPIRREPVRLIKRVLVGAPMSSEHLDHQRLGKPTGLAVFASDNLSSAAYATEEILRVLVPVAGVAAFSFTLPITLALLGVLGILLFSYRQTIKAYPQAGGAYLVTRDNFGILPAQLAGVALLSDYILTVSVSVSAGVAALTSVAPGLHSWRVLCAILFIVIITWGNLRGTKESGRLFAAPTYFFVVMMLVLLGVGAYRFITGTFAPVERFPLEGAGGAVGAFLVLRAFSSGGAAVTGVEAISNGVPAFRPPAWKNARTTLMWMGALLGTMFLGISILAAHLRLVPDPEEKVTVLAQLARATFGTSAWGHALFLGLQAGTMLILVLAANTSFADFPRLASFHAGDHFLPKQLTRFGDRLVYSNGVFALAILSSVLVIMFQASVTKLIPLYAIGVFTSFTLSQSGMAKRHITRKNAGWRRGLAINGAGALVSGAMTVVIAATKFRAGAWIVLLAAPLALVGLLKVNRHYKEEEAILADPQQRPEPGVPRQKVIVPINNADPVDLFALAYGRRVFPIDVKAVKFAPAGSNGKKFLLDRSAADETREVHLSCGNLKRDLVTYIRRELDRVTPGTVLNVIIPETVTTVKRFNLRYLVSRRRLQAIKAALIAHSNVVVTNVTHHRGHEALAPKGMGQTPGQPDDWRHVAILLVANVHNATLAGLRYSRSLGAERLICAHVDSDAEETTLVTKQWSEVAPKVPLTIIESPHRQVVGSIYAFVRELLEQDPRTFITLIIPEFVEEKRWHNLLHSKTALRLKGTFLFEPSVAVSAVPYKITHN